VERGETGVVHLESRTWLLPGTGVSMISIGSNQNPGDRDIE